VPLKPITEGKIEGRIDLKGRRGIRCKKLLDDLKEKRGSCKQKEEALDRTPWITRFGRGYGIVVNETTERMKKMRTCKTECRPTSLA
jgi:hypothetical protein